MGTQALGGLVNSISRFILISICRTIQLCPVVEDYTVMVALLKRLKPVLDEVIYTQISLNKAILEAFEELDIVVNDAREFTERWSPKMSKICTVRQSARLVSMLQISLEQTCCILSRLIQPLAFSFHLRDIQHHIEELKCADQKVERVSDLIEEALHDQRSNLIPSFKVLTKIAESLGLTSNWVLLSETISVEKERLKVELAENKGEISQLDEIAGLISHIRDCMAKSVHHGIINQKNIPSFFRCPLSLKLMVEPVIIASGYSYERAFIQKWFDEGLSFCPKSREALSHFDMIPNYTAKAMISNWCDDNKIAVGSIECDSILIDSLSRGSPDGLSCADSSHTSSPGDISSESFHELRNVLDWKGTEVSSRSCAVDSNLLPFQNTHHKIGMNMVPGNLEQSMEKSCSHGRSISITSIISTGGNTPSLHSSKYGDTREGSKQYEFDSADIFPNRVLLSSEPSSQNAHQEIETNKVLGNWERTMENPCSHEHSESVASIISTGGSRPSPRSSKYGDTHVGSKGYELNSADIFPNRVLVSREPSSQKEMQSPISMVLDRNENEEHNMDHLSFPHVDNEDLTTHSHIQKLVDNLCCTSSETQTAAAAEIRHVAKNSVENRTRIAECGAIRPLISLLYSSVELLQEHAVTALLNLSINDNNKIAIAEAGGLDPLIHVLRSGNATAKENSAASLFSLSKMENYRIKIGCSGAVRALVALLDGGTLRGKKDAATALFNLSIFHENKTRIVQAGAVKHLIELMDPAKGMADKAIALLANLSTVPDGQRSIGSEGGIPLLVEVVETGSQGGKENAASALLQLCISNNRFCDMIIQEGAVPPLVALSQTGTSRAKEKARQILSHLRNRRY